MPELHRTYEELAPLYDIAFSWDVEEEVEWLLERLGSEVRSVLEPACGSGRMFPPFARRGVELTGIELSTTMIRRAHERMTREGLGAPRILSGDMSRFELGAMLDGAICPINSFGYVLTREEALSHFQCVARCLKPGARYLLQVDLVDSQAADFSWNSLEEVPPDQVSRWEEERDGVRVRMSWGAISYDARRRIQTEVARFEIRSGPGAGTCVEDRHAQRKWSWSEWSRLIAESPFRQETAYDGNRDRARLRLDKSLEKERLTWHELVRADDSA